MQCLIPNIQLLFLSGDLRLDDQADERPPQGAAALARRQVRLGLWAAERDRHRAEGGRQLALGHQG